MDVGGWEKEKKKQDKRSLINVIQVTREICVRYIEYVLQLTI